MSKIFITGGIGFIGSFVAKRLLEIGHEVIIYDSFVNYVYPMERKNLYNINMRVQSLKDKADIIRGSTFDQDFLRRALIDCKPSHIVHLAAMPLANLAIEHPEEAVQTILTGTMNLLQVARDLDCLERLVYISSSMVYGDFQKIPAPEDHPVNPKEVYGSLKFSGELLTRSFGRLYGFDYAIVRPSAVYGPTDNNRRVLNIFLENALSGKPLMVRGGNQFLDISYVADTAEGIVAVTVHPNASNSTFNITRGRGRSIVEAANIVAELVPGTVVEVQEPDKKMPSRGTLDISLAQKLLDYDPKIDIEDGIATYLEYLKKQRADIME